MRNNVNENKNKNNVTFVRKTHWYTVVRATKNDMIIVYYVMRII